MAENTTIIGTKRIHELIQLGKLSGKEEIIVDIGSEELTYKTTVDALLGYIATEINKGTFPPETFASTSIIVIPEGQNIPIESRREGSFYLRIVSSDEASIIGGLASRIRVSPNMGLKIIND